jgi:hypothetical protein
MDHREYIKTRGSVEALKEIDSDVIREMLFIAHVALNDVRAIDRVSKELGISENRVEAFNGVLMDIANIECNGQPEIKTQDDIDHEIQNLTL